MPPSGAGFVAIESVGVSDGAEEGSEPHQRRFAPKSLESMPRIGSVEVIDAASRTNECDTASAIKTASAYAEGPLCSNRASDAADEDIATVAAIIEPQDAVLQSSAVRRDQSVQCAFGVWGQSIMIGVIRITRVCADTRRTESLTSTKDRGREAPEKH
jgi:hypothetical protein